MSGKLGFFLDPYRLVTSSGDSWHYSDSEFLINTTRICYDFNIQINAHQTPKISEGIELGGGKAQGRDPVSSSELLFAPLPAESLPGVGASVSHCLPAKGQREQELPLAEKGGPE